MISSRIGALLLFRLVLGNPIGENIKSTNKLYLTFDDGPNEGTAKVLDVLKNYGLKATFFINSVNLKLYSHQAEQVLTRLIAAGHTLADHSYDHMAHNRIDNHQNYKSLDEDLKYFGEMNSKPVMTLMEDATKEWGELKTPFYAMTFVNKSMSELVRLPYTNAWRTKDIQADCPSCTTPTSSGQIGIEIANQLAAQGKQVFGWDVEWNSNWATNRPLYGAEEMLSRLERDPTKSPNKIVLLMHDRAFRPAYSTDDFDYNELDIFLKKAVFERGYIFSTMDKYLNDDSITVSKKYPNSDCCKQNPNT